jgi:muconolactone delta-isomerase
MQFLTMSRRRIDAFPPEAFTPELLALEGQHVRELHAAGTLQQIWVRGDLPGAAIVWESPSESDLRATIATLPLFKAGMLEIVILTPLKPYPGMAPPVVGSTE